MKENTREAVEKTALGGLAVAGSWSSQDISTWLSILLSIITIGWITTQWLKFVINWLEERRAKKKGAAQAPQDCA